MTLTQQKHYLTQFLGATHGFSFKSRDNSVKGKPPLFLDHMDVWVKGPKLSVHILWRPSPFKGEKFTYSWQILFDGKEYVSGGRGDLEGEVEMTLEEME